MLLPEITATCKDKKVLVESGADRDRVPPKNMSRADGEEGEFIRYALIVTAVVNRL